MSGNSIDKPLPVGREEAHIAEASCMAAVSDLVFRQMDSDPGRGSETAIEDTFPAEHRLMKTLLTYNL
ncbi:hypothetical protein X734_32570 [Mesorhizobium sp. L2C084A000]|nr:hypothetical protein X734_32570 [Mesorhizobium sp. L2C084A000]